MLAQMVSEPTHLLEMDEDPELQARIARKALKTDFEGWVTYRQGDYIEGSARAKNIGSGEIALLLNRFIAPDETIAIQLDCLTYRGLPIQLSGLVESCSLSKDRRGFIAVVRAYRGRAN